jgi:hypothetical protein
MKHLCKIICVALFIVILLSSGCSSQEKIKKDIKKDIPPADQSIDKEKQALARDYELLKNEKRVTISLPWSPEQEVIGILPLGELLYHEPPGHPGFCIGWTYNADIIASADGVIKSIAHDYEIDRPGDEGLFEVLETVGQLSIRYIHLQSVNPRLLNGSVVKKGDLIGHPMVKSEMRNYAFHWDIRPDIKTEMIITEHLCPLTYLDEDSRARLEKIWANQEWEFKSQYPKICNGWYDGVDSFIDLYDKQVIDGEFFKPNGQKIEKK